MNLRHPPSEAGHSDAPIVVVGAGLAGCLVATLLAKRGFNVQVYERRPDMRAAEIAAGRSINLALSTRGIDALELAGVAERVLADAIPMPGRIMHGVDGALTYQPYGQDGQAIRSVSRRGLNETLMTAAEQAGARLFFNKRCLDIDPTARKVTLADDDGRATVQARIIIGADGVFSAVRGHLQRSDRYQYEQLYLDHGYKELAIPPGENGSFRLEKDGLHIWPRHDFMLIALPNADGSFTCTLFQALDGPEGLHALDTPEKVRAFFAKWFPDAVPLMPTLVEDFFGNPTSSLCTIRCAPYHRDDSVLLIGDAAHAVVPFYGQGMNAAFEDCAIIERMLQANGGRLEGVPARFSAERKEDADAIRQLALDNFVEMRSKVANPLFLLRKKVDKLLHKLAPSLYVPLYSMVTFSTIPYAETVRRAQQQQKALVRGAVVLGAALVGALAVALMR